MILRSAHFAVPKRCNLNFSPDHKDKYPLNQNLSIYPNYTTKNNGIIHCHRNIQHRYFLRHAKQIYLVKMEMRGVEPLSENPSAEISSITAYVLTFPRFAAHKQAANLSSFINLFRPQSLKRKGPHNFDAGYSNCEQFKADEQHLGC